MFIAEYPPSNLGGGPTLMSRLWKDYPKDRLTIVTTSFYDSVAPEEGRVDSKRITLPTTKKQAPFILKKFQVFFDWCTLHFYLIYLCRLIKKNRPGVIVTVAMGQFFILALLLARITKIPLITIVHDEYVTGKTLSFFGGKTLEKFYFKMAMKASDQVYAVSPAMQTMLAAEYQKKSILQMPAIEDLPDRKAEEISRGSKGVVKIFFSGTLNLCRDNIEIIKRMLLEGKLENLNLNRDVELHIYSGSKPEVLEKKIVNTYRVIYHGWASQEVLKKDIQTADILFLPHSFVAASRISVKTSMPTKIADYLAASKPILISAPPESALHDYANTYGFGFLVPDPSLEQHAAAVKSILSAPLSAQRAKMRGAFLENHDLIKQKKQFWDNLSEISRKVSEIYAA